MKAIDLTHRFWTKPQRFVRALFHRRALESELEEELQQFVRLLADRLMADGMSPAQARREAMRELGGIEQVKEDCRDTRGVRWLEELGQDIGYAVRTLRKTPTFALGAVALLALVLALNVMFASLSSALFLDPLPFPASEQLVAISQDFSSLRSGGRDVPFSLLEVADLQHQIRLVEEMAAFYYAVCNVALADRIERVQSAMVSPNFFAVLGVPPVRGAVFDSDPPRAPKVDGVVISERLRGEFSSVDSGLVGKQIRLDDHSRTVQGIMPADFEFPLPRFSGWGDKPRRADIWQLIAPKKAEMEDRGLARVYDVVGRLRSHSSLRDLNRELDRLSSRWKEQYGSIYQTGGLHLHASLLGRTVDPRIQSAVRALGAAALLVWLISVANLIAMLLARAAAARPQMAIRMALGGGPSRLLRQAMSEGLLLGTIGSLAGTILGSLIIVIGRNALITQSSPLVSHTQVNANVMLAVIGLSMVTTLLLGLIPGRFAVRTATSDALKHDRGMSAARLRPHQLRDRLVICETALALVLLVGTGLLTESLLRLDRVRPGFNPAGVVTIELSLPDSRYVEERAVADYFSGIAKEVARLPGITSAAFVSVLPFSGATTDSSFTIEGLKAGRDRPPDEEIRVITPDYFRVLEIPIRNGRVFTPTDNQDSPPVAVVNEALARRYWGTDMVVGKRVKLDYPLGSGWRSIVGVVGNIKHNRLDRPVEPELYLPHKQMATRRMMLAARTNRNPQETIAMMRDRIQSIDSGQPVANPRTLARQIADSILPRRLTALLVGVFAAIGLLLAAAGIYAVVSYTTIERRHEFAVRMAVGADRGHIIAIVLKESGRLLLWGTVIGCGIAAGVSLCLKPLLYDVSIFDPVVVLGMLGFVPLCGLVAAYIPARRATRHNLAAALAHD